MRFWVLSCLLLAAPGSIFAQASDSGVSAATKSKETKSTKVFDWKFTLLGTGLFAATATDTYSTFLSQREWCPACDEANPFAAPFIHRGPAMAYPAGAGFDTAVMGIASYMRRSENPALKKIWWLAPAAVIPFHIWGMHHNFGLQQRCQHDPTCRPYKL